jgi:hypothetical protein
MSDLSEKDISDLPDTVQSWIGSTLKAKLGPLPVEIGMCAAFTAATGDKSSAYFQTGAAARDGDQDGQHVPPVMLPIWVRSLDGARPSLEEQQASEFHFRLKNALDLPLGIVKENAVYFYHRVKVGDVISCEQQLMEVTEERTNRLGIGRDWLIHINYYRQDGTLMGMESMRLFGYKKVEQP